jgi:hypothetical protein
VSDAPFSPTPITPSHATIAAPLIEEERPPSCPSCNRRLVILATHQTRDEHGEIVYRQLWGCPRGHATAYRTRGCFSPIELLEELIR